MTYSPLSFSQHTIHLVVLLYFFENSISLSRGVCKMKTPSVLYENYREIHVYCVWRKGDKGDIHFRQGHPPLKLL